MTKRLIVLLLPFVWASSAFAQKVVVSHGPYGSAGPLYAFSATPPFSFLDSSDAYGRLVNHVKYVSGKLYSVASQSDYIYVHDTSLVLLDSIPVDSGSNLWMGDYTSDGRGFVAEYLLNRIAAYDLNSHSQIWSTDVNLSPTYVGLYNGYLLAVSSGYDMGSYTAGPSTLYIIDTATGNILDSLRLGINLLSATPWNGDTVLAVGGAWGDTATHRLYVLTYSSGFSVVDSFRTPTNLSFVSRLSNDTALVAGYSYVGYFVLSSGTFLPFNYGSHVGFSSAVAYGDYVFVPAAEDYVSNGNLLIFDRAGMNLVSTATLSVSPSSITLIPAPVSVGERTAEIVSRGVRYYDASGRRLQKEPDRGVFFVVEGGRVRKVLRF